MKNIFAVLTIYLSLYASGAAAQNLVVPPSNPSKPSWAILPSATELQSLYDQLELPGLPDSLRPKPPADFGTQHQYVVRPIVTITGSSQRKDFFIRNAVPKYHGIDAGKDVTLLFGVEEASTSILINGVGTNEAR